MFLKHCLILLYLEIDLHGTAEKILRVCSDFWKLMGGVWILKHLINMSLTHQPLVIDTQPAVTFGPLIIADKSSPHIVPSTWLASFFLFLQTNSKSN